MISKGWEKLVKQMTNRLQAIKAKVTIVETKKTAAGTLQVFYDIEMDHLPEENRQAWFEVVDLVVNDAERQSRATCELCGSPGSFKSNFGKPMVLCDKCKKPEELKK